MKNIAIDISDFGELISNGYIYVDKTSQLFPLISNQMGKSFFLSRPRRFGKSLLLSTLKAIFQGKRELFKGLAIDSMDYDWQKYPVIHLDLGSGDVQNAKELLGDLDNMLNRIARQNAITLSPEQTPKNKFFDLIELLADKSETHQVALLVDEYDKPLLGHLGKPDVTEIREVLKSFYSVIKTTGSLQRFALITGVSKFSKVSIFSGLNNLVDLSMDPRTATLLGYTHEELEKYFSEQICSFGEANSKSEQEAIDELGEWYDGYRFTADGESVFNPVSIGLCLSTKIRANYWFETGTPTFLIDLLKHEPMSVERMMFPEAAFSVYEPESPSLPALLFQTGYLTVKGFKLDGDIRKFELGFPNREVSTSFNERLARSFSGCSEFEMATLSDRLTQAILGGNVGTMLEALSLFFAKIPYDITLKNEKYYQSLFYAVFTLLGSKIEAEVRTNVGRIDAVVKTAEKIFIFEFKLNGTAEEALAQIREKRYAERFADDKRQVVPVGVAFDPETRNIGKWVAE